MIRTGKSINEKFRGKPRASGDDPCTAGFNLLKG